MLKAIFGRSSSTGSDGSFPKIPSMNDFSLHTQEAVEDMSGTSAASDSAFPASTSPAADNALPRSSSGKNHNVWGSVFHPGRNMNWKHHDASQYDSDPNNAATTWQMIIRSENLKRFGSLDADKDGFISAEDLRIKLGRSADVEGLIKQADKNNDGKLSYSEFEAILRDQGA